MYTGRKDGFIICHRTESDMDSAYTKFVALTNKHPDLFTVKKYRNLYPLEFPFTIVLETKDINTLDDLLVEPANADLLGKGEMYMLCGREHEIDAMELLNPGGRVRFQEK